MTRLEELGARMEELAPYVIPSKNFCEAKACEYYEIQAMYQEEKAKVSALIAMQEKAIKQHQEKVFINGYGEATHREITSSSYKRAQNKLSKDILSFLK